MSVEGRTESRQRFTSRHASFSLVLVKTRSGPRARASSVFQIRRGCRLIDVLAALIDPSQPSWPLRGGFIEVSSTSAGWTLRLTLACARCLSANVKILLPVIRGDFVFAGTAVVTQRLHDRLLEGRHLVECPNFSTEDRTRVRQPPRLETRHAGRPTILSTGQIDRPGRVSETTYGRLRRFLHSLRVFLEVAAKPVWETGCQMLDRFAVVATA